uniref:Uncharacterized protein n=1 Tax=Rhizophora mucronata TaxID=61149 RepID=A0A2P2PMG5_RHIMU
MKGELINEDIAICISNRFIFPKQKTVCKQSLHMYCD